LELYADETSEKHKAMVEQIRKNLDLTSLKFMKLNDLVEAIGLPKEKLCTHCWDGTSTF
jgi:amidophosphoribosyltransferase